MSSAWTHLLSILQQVSLEKSHLRGTNRKAALCLKYGIRNWSLPYSFLTPLALDFSPFPNIESRLILPYCSVPLFSDLLRHWNGTTKISSVRLCKHVYIYVNLWHITYIIYVIWSELFGMDRRYFLRWSRSMPNKNLRIKECQQHSISCYKKK